MSVEYNDILIKLLKTKEYLGSTKEEKYKMLSFISKQVNFKNISMLDGKLLLQTSIIKNEKELLNIFLREKDSNIDYGYMTAYSLAKSYDNEYFVHLIENNNSIQKFLNFD